MLAVAPKKVELQTKTVITTLWVFAIAKYDVKSEKSWVQRQQAGKDSNSFFICCYMISQNFCFYTFMCSRLRLIEVRTGRSSTAGVSIT